MNIRKTTPLLALLTLVAAPTANAQDLLGRTEPKYDLTGSDLARNWFDYAYINGEVPTYAERKGLAGLPTVEIRRNYVYLEDSDGSLNIPWQSFDDLEASFNFALNEVYQVLPDEFVFVYLFTSFETGVGAFFYSPEANLDRGIGSERFDQNGPSAREGFVFMNYWKSFEQLFPGVPQDIVRAQARSVFNQEAGHRWASFVPAGADGNGAGPDVMLGRDEGHWNYFLETGGSPMEGNGWRDNTNGTFTTITSFDNWHFSDLDLYLMGVLPSADVDPWFVIQNPDTNGQTDLFGQLITKSSPPQIIQPVTVTGVRADLTIEDIQAVHGVRNPGVGLAPNKWRVVFVMLAGQNDTLTPNEKLEFEELVDDYALGFKQGARNLGSLDYLLMADPKSPIGGTCAMIDDCDALEASICLPNVGNPPVGLCTRPCTTEGSCPTDYCCQEFSGSQTTVCLPDAMCAPECACDVTLGSCDQGCACDTACVNPCPCDTDSACQNNCSCDPNCQVACACDTTAACEMGCACDTDCGMTGCTCDTSFACDRNAENTGNCACDAECVACTCDTSFGCDRNAENTGDCACDAECKTLPTDRERGGCSCSAVETHGGTWLSLMLVSLLGIAFTRRRS